MPPRLTHVGSTPAPQIDAAQIRYDGNWNPEPGAWPRFRKTFQNDTGVRVVMFEGAGVEARVLAVDPEVAPDEEAGKETSQETLRLQLTVAAGARVQAILE